MQISNVGLVRNRYFEEFIDLRRLVNDDDFFRIFFSEKLRNLNSTEKIVCFKLAAENGVIFIRSQRKTENKKFQ